MMTADTRNIENLMGRNVVGLLYVPADYLAPPPGLRGAWRRHLMATASVRPRDYMTTLFQSRFPNGTVVDIAQGQILGDAIERAEHLVLLYPDAIGAHYAWIERAIAKRWPHKSLLALNGRQRFFRLDGSMRRRLVWRRLLESSRLAEWMFLPLFVLITLVLLLLDLCERRQ